MNVITLRTISDFDSLPREKMFRAHLIVCGMPNGSFRIMKDRFEGRYGGYDMSPEYLSEYIEKYS